MASIAEAYWSKGKPADAVIRALLMELLRPTTWQEVLSIAGSLLLEGDWLRQIPELARRFEGMALWESQKQALYLLDTFGDSLLVADPTGSGKTRLGAGLHLLLLLRLYALGQSDRTRTLIVTSPQVKPAWESEFGSLDANQPKVVSQGMLSRPDSGEGVTTADSLKGCRILFLDEAHNYLNHKSNRSTSLLGHGADHTILFTATPEDLRLQENQQRFLDTRIKAAAALAAWNIKAMLRSSRAALQSGIVGGVTGAEQGFLNSWAFGDMDHGLFHGSLQQDFEAAAKGAAAGFAAGFAEGAIFGFPESQVKAQATLDAKRQAFLAKFAPNAVNDTGYESLNAPNVDPASGSRISNAGGAFMLHSNDDPELGEMNFGLGATGGGPGDIGGETDGPILGGGGGADTIPEGMRISTLRVTQPGETFFRYESADSVFSRITATGGVTPGTFAAPTSDGFLPDVMRIPAYNLPSPWIPRSLGMLLEPPAWTPIIGPRPVMGGFGNEVIFPLGY